MNETESELYLDEEDVCFAASTIAFIPEFPQREGKKVPLCCSTGAKEKANTDDDDRRKTNENMETSIRNLR
jgi:hypothetical protein